VVENARAVFQGIRSADSGGDEPMTEESARVGHVGKRRFGAMVVVLAAALVVVLVGLFLWLNICCGADR
jgi:hypothetical protein